MSRIDRRSMILGSAGTTAALAGSRLHGAQAATPETAAPAPFDWIRPDGAIGDGASHPLSERFATLEDAQAVYPHAAALTDEIDWCALQGAIAAATAQGSGAVHVPNRGTPYVLNRSLTLNPNCVTMRGDGASLAFGALQSGESAVVFDGSDGPQYGHDRHVFEGFELIGPGAQPTDTNGLVFRAGVDAMSSRAQVRDCVVRGFGNAVTFGDRAYLISFAHSSFNDCHFVLNCPYGLTDAGENVSFDQCVLFNSYCLISNSAGFELKFTACSLDYADRIVWDNNGLIDFMSCRVEIAPPKTVPFHNGTGRIDFHSGFFLINGEHEPVLEELFAFNDPKAQVHMIGLRGWNWLTTTGRLTNGPGEIFWYDGRRIASAPDSVPAPGH